MGRLLADLRFAARMFARQPTLAAAAVATLALGIGANSAIFSVVDSALLTPPPFREPGRVVVAYGSSPINARQVGVSDKFPVSWGDFYEWGRQVRSFARLAMFEPDTMSLAGAGPPLQLDVMRSTGEFSAVLGTPAMLGRGLEPGDDLPGKPAAILLSYGCWRRSFGGDMGVVGRKVLLDREPATVIGVMPPSFTFPRGAEMPAGFGFPTEPDAWVPFCLTTAERHDHGRMTSTVIGRLRAGVGVAAAEQELRAIYRRLAREYPRSHQDLSARLLPITEQMVGGVRQTLLVLWAAAGLVLLIACVNVANLLLARAASRQQEIAVRTAIGAGRGHLVGQLLAESGLLALAGGILGIGVAALGLRGLGAVVPVDLAGAVTGSLDGRMLAFTGLLCAASVVLAGLPPALQASRPDLVRCLRGGTRAGGGGVAGSRRTRDALVVAELALSLLLLAGAGLLLRSFARVFSVDPGFHPAHVLAFDLNLPPHRVSIEGRRQFYGRVVERLRALPGVAGAAAINELPLSGGIWVSGWEVEGRPKLRPADLVAVDGRVVTPEYFAVMGIPLRRGRLLATGDAQGGAAVAVIDDAMARAFWPGEDPIGKRIRNWNAGSRADDPEYPWTTVVGVVGSVHYDNLEAKPRIELYRPMAQSSRLSPAMTFVMRSAGDPLALAAAARGAVRGLDPDQPIAGVRTLEQVVAGSVAPRRFALLLLGMFAALALTLAAVGVYGVTYHSVVRRTRELGLRIALGARPHQVLRLLIAEAGALVALGLGIGLVAAFALTRAMSSLLYGVGPADPPTYAGIAVLLTLAALLSTWIPGRRATRLDPAAALRGE